MRGFFQPGLRDDVTTNSLKISIISLKFNGMIATNMKQLAFKNGHA